MRFRLNHAYLQGGALPGASSVFVRGSPRFSCGTGAQLAHGAWSPCGKTKTACVRFRSPAERSPRSTRCRRSWRPGCCSLRRRAGLSTSATPALDRGRRRYPSSLAQLRPLMRLRAEDRRRRSRRFWGTYPRHRRTRAEGASSPSSFLARSRIQERPSRSRSHAERRQIPSVSDARPRSRSELEQPRTRRSTYSPTRVEARSSGRTASVETAPRSDARACTRRHGSRHHWAAAWPQPATSHNGRPADEGRRDYWAAFCRGLFFSREKGRVVFRSGLGIGPPSP